MNFLNAMRTLLCGILLSIALPLFSDEPPDGWLMNKDFVPKSLEQIQATLQQSEGTGIAAMTAAIAPAGAPAYAQLPPEDLTILREAVAGLENDPARVYQFVKERCDFRPYLGHGKGPLRAFFDRSGNELDLCILLAAMLELCVENDDAAQVSLVIGSMHIPLADAARWLRVQPGAVMMALNHAGMGASVTGNVVNTVRVWVRFSWSGEVYLLDPAFKTYTWNPGSLGAAPLLAFRQEANYTQGLLMTAANPKVAASKPNVPGERLNSMNLNGLRQELGRLRNNLLNTSLIQNRSRPLRDLIGYWSLPELTMETPPLPEALPFAVGLHQLDLGAWSKLHTLFKTKIEFIHPDWSYQVRGETRGCELFLEDLSSRQIEVRVTGADAVPDSVPSAGSSSAAVTIPILLDADNNVAVVGQGYHFGLSQRRPITAPVHQGHCILAGWGNGLHIISSTVTEGDPDFAIGAGFPQTIAAGTTAQLPITFRSNSKGLRTGNLRLVVRDQTFASRRWTVDFPLAAFSADLGQASLIVDGVTLTPPRTKARWIDSNASDKLVINVYLPADAGSPDSHRLASRHDYSVYRTGTYVIPMAFDAGADGMLKAAGRDLTKVLSSNLTEAEKKQKQLSLTLQMMGLNWFQQTGHAEQMMESLHGSRNFNHFRIGRVAQEYKSGSTASSNAAGFYIDVANQYTSTFSAGNGVFSSKFFEVMACLSSAQEHGVLEQSQRGIEAASSTTRMIERALASNKAVHWLNAASSSQLASLPGYSDRLKRDLQTALAGHPANWLLLPADGSLPVTGQAEAWKGYGAMLRQTSTATESVAMLISGGYHGGFSGTQGEAQPDRAIQQSETQTQLNRATPPQPSSTEPINLVTGEYYYDKTDISIGNEGVMGVSFARHYSSAMAEIPGALGHGWSHNWESGVELMTDTSAAFGSRHAQDAVTALVAFMVMDDLIPNNGLIPSPQVVPRTLCCLVANWCVDALKDNMAKVYLGNKTLFFSNHSAGNGPFYPPPGVTDSLTRLTTPANAFNLTRRDEGFTEFRSVGTGANQRCLLHRLVSPDGHAVSLTYTDTGGGVMQVNTVRDANARGLDLDYTGGILTKLNTLGDTQARTVIFQYDNATTTKNLIRITDPEGRFTSHEYALPANHLMTSLRDGLGRVIATNEYDSQGRAIRQLAYGDKKKLWHYFFSDLYTVERDPTGGRTTYYFDDQMRTIGKRDQVDDLRRTEYDFNNFPVRVTDAENHEVRTFFDADLRPYRVEYPDGTASSQHYDSRHRPTLSISRGGKHTLMEYNTGNTKHRPDRVKVFNAENDPNPRTTHYTYHTLGKQAGQVATITDPAGRVTTLAYDTRGAPASVAREVEVDTGSGTQLVSLQSRTVFNARGDLTDSFDERSIRTQTLYNAARQPVKVTRFLAAGSTYAVTTVYDRAGDAVQTFDSMPVPYRAGQTFSAQGKLLRTYRITQDGRFDFSLSSNEYASEQLYDMRDWPLQTNFLAPSGIPWKRVSVVMVPYADGSPFQTTDPLGRTITFANSPEQTTTSVTDDAGFRVITSTNVTTRQKLVSDAFPSMKAADPLALPGDVLRLNYQHAEDGELLSLTNRRSKTYRMGYNGYGQLQSRQTPGNRFTGYTYTVDGQPETLTRPDNSVVSWAYYPESGRLHTQTDPAGTIEHRYDVSGNLTWVRDQATGSTLSSAFDNVGRLQTFTDSRGQQTTYSWLPNGLLRSVRYHAQRVAAHPATASAAIVNGAVATLTLGSSGMGYTGAPAVTLTSPPAASGGTTAKAEAVVTDGVVTGLRITNAGSGYTTAPVVSIAPPPPDLVVSYDYYPDRSLAKVTDWTGRATEFRYYQDGRLHSIERPNGTSRAFAYTQAGELALVAESKPNNPAGTVIYLMKFAYNKRGQVSQKSTFPREPANATHSPPMTAVPGDDNQLITVNGVDQVHDLRGNLCKGMLPSGQMGTDATTYVFDSRNRLTAMEGGHAYGYDVGNNRISITTGGVTTELSVAPLGGLSQVISEKAAGGAGAERLYIYTPQGQLLYHLDPDISAPATATPDALAASYYHYDITGSTVALSGDDGSVKGRVSYTPYGEITSKDAALDTRFLFCGAYGVQSDPSGLIHMRARYYHPYLCRFLNEDPIEFSGGMNWYAYANGNPLNLVDPTGLFGLRDAVSIGVGFIPGVGTLQSAVELVTGYDYIASEPVNRGLAAAGLFAGLIPGGKGALKAGSRVMRVANVTGNTLRRPALWRETQEAIVEKAARNAQGELIDPNTGRILNDVFHYGHVAGRENRRLVREGELYNMTQKEFSEYVNSHPGWFQVEGVAENLSHLYEKFGSNLSWDRIIGHDALQELGLGALLNGAAHATNVVK